MSKVSKRDCISPCVLSKRYNLSYTAKVREAGDTMTTAHQNTAHRNPQQIKRDITQLEYQRWQAVFNGEPMTLVHDYNAALDQLRHEFVQATLKRQVAP